MNGDVTLHNETVISQKSKNQSKGLKNRFQSSYRNDEHSESGVSLEKLYHPTAAIKVNKTRQIKSKAYSID